MSQQEFVPETNATVTASRAVEEASGWVRWLVQRESRGNGDRKNAMERLARRYPGMSKTLIRNLLYRVPRDMLLSSYLAIREAYLAECERQEAALRHERKITEAKSLLGQTFIRASDFVAGQNNEALNDDL